MAREGTFREDLLDRLDVLRIEVPSLRERMEDLRELLEALAERRSSPVRIELTKEAWKVLEEHHWPGNVRELGTVIERIACCTEGGEVGGDELRGLMGHGTRETVRGGEATQLAAMARTLRGMETLAGENLERLRREVAIQELAKCGSERTAAKALGMDRDTVKRVVRRGT